MYHIHRICMWISINKQRDGRYAYLTLPSCKSSHCMRGSTYIKLKQYITIHYTHAGIQLRTSSAGTFAFLCELSAGACVCVKRLPAGVQIGVSRTHGHSCARIIGHQISEVFRVSGPYEISPI